MKIRFALAIVGLMILGSCAYKTCPTYIKNDVNDKPQTEANA